MFWRYAKYRLDSAIGPNYAISIKPANRLVAKQLLKIMIKHYKIQEREGEYFIFNEAKPETDKCKVDEFGLLKWTALFARAGYKVSFTNMENMEERVVCHQSPKLEAMSSADKSWNSFERKIIQ